MSSTSPTPTSVPTNQKRGGRGGAGGNGGPGRGRGRGGGANGGGGRKSGRGRGNRRSKDRNGNGNANNQQMNQNQSNRNNYNESTNPSASSSRAESASLLMPEIKDEEVLIAFMPYLKGDFPEATGIHNQYQSSNDQQAFLKAARGFLSRQKSGNGSAPKTHTIVQNNKSRINIPSNPFAQSSTLTHNDNNNTMQALERDMMGLMADDDPVIQMPNMMPTQSQAIGMQQPSQKTTESRFFPSAAQTNNHSNMMTGSAQPITPPRSRSSQQQQQQPPQQRHQSSSSSSHPSPFPSMFATPSNTNSTMFPNAMPGSVDPASQTPSRLSSWASTSPINISATMDTNRNQPSPLVLPTATPGKTRSNSTTSTSPLAVSAEAPKVMKREYQPKRLWTRLEEQPGRILANNTAASPVGAFLNLRPRQELKAQWALPLSYLRQHAKDNDLPQQSVRDLLEGLSVGLFRQGCTENGSQASIVSKEILTPPGESRRDYTFQVVQDAVVGTVPFFSPRTPGRVVFRLYWHDKPLHTLATGPSLNICVTERDFETTIRFVLSNFKAKKVNPTSLSSLNSLALVLDQFQFSLKSGSGGNGGTNLENAGRSVWGCICEARKVVDACATDYQKTTIKLQKMEENLEEFKEKIEQAEGATALANTTKRGGDSTDGSHEDEPSEAVLAYREKQKTLMSGRASCERKWRDSQLAFSSILRAIATNPSITYILRRDQVAKLRLEYELWCPLTEEFAVPGDVPDNMWYQPLTKLPHSVNDKHFRMCIEARSKMQHKSLGFDPRTQNLDSILFPDGNNQMNPAAVSVFNQLSAAMGQLYQDNFATADHILRQREMIRMKVESLVAVCDGFPPGTTVAVFGSSANGFGSPKSDLDMCLQIPSGFKITSDEDPTGALKMSKLAHVLEENGMKDVDTGRLTARIPVIKFYCPKPGGKAEGEDVLMECDLSMHNPLAVLNTSLLRTYAEINPVPRVLAGVIKRWAKAREINNPAKHTLSSYGYILMLLHFLTFHQRTGNGLVEASTKNKANKNPPLLPNLQWMDSTWPTMPQGTPYKEHVDLPKNYIKHPMEDRNPVNAYYYRPNAAMLRNLQHLFPGQDLSLGILLASFFRYYAYEFDYKKNVVSLHSTISHGMVEREIKAEMDGWRNYSAALTIEDPFETFYDVAHVLRGGYYHRIRREFAVAYSKIADVASGKTTSVYNNISVDLTKMVGMELIDWICEPIVTTDETDLSSSQK